jgi:PAS domain S-box-containing protein
MPHGTRYMWDPGMVWLHVISDALIALAYFCIPMALIYFVRKRRDTPRGWVVWMFGAFIVSCGMTHVMEVWNIWHANYLLSGFVKAITAAFSVATAICLVRLIPQALLWPSPTTVETMNQKLQMEAEERARVKKELKQTEETLRLLLDGVKDHAIFMLDPEGRVVSWTSCATRLLGYQSNEIIGRHVSCFYSSAHSKSGKPGLELERAMLNGRSEEIGQRKRKDGTLFWAEAMESPLFDESGTLRGFAKVLLAQVFQNLIGNALKFTRSRATAVIEIGRTAAQLGLAPGDLITT